MDSSVSWGHEYHSVCCGLGISLRRLVERKRSETANIPRIKEINLSRRKQC